MISWKLNRPLKKFHQFGRYLRNLAPTKKTTYKVAGNNNLQTTWKQMICIVDPNKFIRVNIRNELSWDKHIENIVAKGNKMLDFIRHNIEDCSKSVAYTSMVRHWMEYAYLWILNAASLESLLYCLTHMIGFLWNTDIWYKYCYLSGRRRQR